MNATNQNLILIVDANPTDVKLLSNLVENYGYKSLIAYDSKIALEIARQVLPILVIWDINTFEVSDIDECLSFQQWIVNQKIPVIFMTDLVEPSKLIDNLQSDNFDYITKPFNQQEVISCINFYIKRQLLSLSTFQDNNYLVQILKGFTAIECELLKITRELDHRLEERSSQLFLVWQELQKVQQKLLAKEEKLRIDNLYDKITGLPNRTWLIERLQNIISRASQNPDFQYAVLSIGVDRFQIVNDSLGHLLGDELLKNIAHRLKECLNNAGTVARLGGDEFIVLLENIQSYSDATAIAEYIQERFKLPFQLNDYEIFAGVSTGITLSNIKYQSPIEMLRDAGIAMSQAKQAGKGCYQVLTPENRSKAIARLQLENDLRYGMERNEFYLEYQPIYCLTKGKILGFEALVRWRHPSRGRVSPNEFIPTVEEIGLIDRLGYWVLQEATRQLKKWQEAFPCYPNLVMNINISAKQLKQVQLIFHIENLCRQIGLKENSLKLEITESCFMEISTEEVDMLHHLKNMGIGLCIDDFGTGYSSLSRLHKFPMDTIKVDRSFVQRLGTGLRETEIVQSIGNLAHNLGLDLVAEGIETNDQLEKLQELGYEFGQGYLFSEPLDKETATQLLTC
ncbi:MAG TPA: EAL domain-containing protein [Leptolyngbyaceae cyanobacterium]